MVNWYDFQVSIQGNFITLCFISVQLTAELVTKEDNTVEFWEPSEGRKILESIERQL